VTDAFGEVNVAASTNDNILAHRRACANRFRCDRCTDGIVGRASSAATGFPSCRLGRTAARRFIAEGPYR
jgi:hypothetical protein